MEYTVNIEVRVTSDSMNHSTRVAKVFSIVVDEDTVEKALKAAHIKARGKWEGYDWDYGVPSAYFDATAVYEGKLKNLLSKRVPLRKACTAF